MAGIYRIVLSKPGLRCYLRKLGFDLGEVAAAIATGDLSHKAKTMSSTQSLAPNHGSVLDKTWERHCQNGLTRARPVGNPFLEKAALGGLRFRALQRVEEIGGALRKGWSLLGRMTTRNGSRRARLWQSVQPRGWIRLTQALIQLRRRTRELIFLLSEWS
jgi:hypothetical protein